jgi:hypothetical protein
MSGNLEVGGVEFDADELLGQLRNDLRDDWFPDPLRFSDMLDGRLVVKCILDNVEKNHGHYLATPRALHNLPKPNFTLRYALETGLGDRAIYHGLVSYLVPFYDRLVPWNVFSHRCDRTSSSRKYMFKRGVPAWKDFVGSVKSTLSTDAFLVSADVSNYYEQIDLQRLKKGLIDLIPSLDATTQQKAKIRLHVDRMFGCLGTWAYEEARGLPQNRDASSFLANLYMRPVDIAIRERGYADRYFRYMDDIKIVCNDAYDARRALKCLSLALREIGLSLNSKKTEICPPKDESRLNEQLSGASAEVEHIDTLWRTRTRQVILRSIPKLKDLTLRLIRQGKTDSKDFRFCIGRIEDLALCDEIAVPQQFFSEITPAMIRSVIDVPSSTDLFARYLEAVPVGNDDLAVIAAHLLDDARALYSWQNFHLWSLLARKRYSNGVLLNHARRVLSVSEDTATRAGATVYAGVMGTNEIRQSIAERFKCLDSFMGQRCALIAVHEVPFKPIIETHVKPFVRSDLTGVYRKLHERPGCYFAPLEKRPITKFLNLDRDYD